MKKKCFLMLLTILIVPMLAFAGSTPTAGLVSTNDSVSFTYGADAYSVNHPVMMVSKSNPDVNGANQAKDGNYVLHYDDNPAYFKGAKFCVMGIGNQWSGGSDPGDVNLDKAMACAQISGSYVTLSLSNSGSDYASEGNPDGNYYQGAVPYIKLADGSQVIAGHAQWPNGQYLVDTQNSKITMWKVDNTNKSVVALGAAAREMAKAKIK